MANEVRVSRRGTKPDFQPGELVEFYVDPNVGDERDYYVVIVEGVGQHNDFFSGTVLMSGTPDDEDMFPGHRSDRFVRESFRRFVGSIEIIQK